MKTLDFHEPFKAGEKVRIMKTLDFHEPFKAGDKVRKILLICQNESLHKLSYYNDLRSGNKSDPGTTADP